MIGFSSIIVFLLRFTWSVLSVASYNIVNLPFTTHESHTRADELLARSKFTIVLSAERCQSTRRLNIGSVFLSDSATA